MDLSENELKIIKNRRDEKLVFAYIMLTRQATRLADCLTHIIRLPTSNDGKAVHESKILDFKGFRAYMQTELSDVLCQAKKMIEILGLDFDETLKMGLQRDIEKKTEYLKKHPNEEWI